jgi:hypothetical protein
MPRRLRLSIARNFIRFSFPTGCSMQALRDKSVYNYELKRAWERWLSREDVKANNLFWMD